MKQNSPRFFKCLKTGLFLMGFLFFNFNTVGQTISNLVVSDVPVCKGSNITLTFTVTNADNGASNKYFTTNTQYWIYDYTNNQEYLNGVYTANDQLPPSGRAQSAEIELSIPILDNDTYPPASDYVIRIYSDNGGESPFSSPFTVKAKPTPPPITNNGPVCEGGSLQLTAESIPNASYSWNGPNFSSNEQNPTIQNITPADAGDYVLSIIVDGCTSEPVSTTVQVVPIIANNVINNEQKSCGAFIPEILEGSGPSGGNGNYSFLWESSTLGPETGFAPATGNNNEINYQPGNISETTWYRRIVESLNCNDKSNVIEITIDPEINNNNISFFHGTSGTIEKTVDENQSLSLNAPEGTVFTYIDFASYGTPTEDNGTFIINENCHASTSQTVTESYFLGVNAATIPATNNVFTDPCVGTFKRLTVSAYYAEAFCVGANPGAIVGTTMDGDNVNYQWQISTNGPAGNFSPAPGNNTNQNYEPGILDQEIWLKRIVSSGVCTSESPVLYIPVKDIYTWTGAENSNWNNPANWSCTTLPTLETDVLIPEDLASNNYPEITVGANAYARDLTIEPGAAVVVTDNWVSIAGTLNNADNLNAETGSISFEGASAQTIPAGAFENNRIQNLRINNTSGVTSQATIEVSRMLKVETGSFDTGNQLTLISNATQTALIDGSGTGEVIGNVTMQRYLDNAFGYKYFATPFSASKVGDFTDIDLQADFPNFYRYDENRQVNIDGTFQDATGWETYITAENALNIMEGYALNFGAAKAPLTVSLTGEVNNGNYSLELKNNNGEYTKGFHLVGNPYPSPIAWDASGWTKTNIDDQIHFFTAGSLNRYTGTYESFVNEVSSNGTTAANIIIPSMQGFFVKVSDSETENYPVTGTLGITNATRLNNFAQQFYRNREPAPKALIRINAAFKGETNKDGMVIYFEDQASSGFESQLDAHKLLNTDVNVPNLYSLSPEMEQLSINAVARPEENEGTIPLGITTERSGTMSISLQDLENLPYDFAVFLRDKEKNKTIDLRKQAYSFEAKKGKTNSRFELLFSNEPILNEELGNEFFSVFSSDGQMQVDLNLEEQEEAVLNLSTVTGQLLESKAGRGKEQVNFDGISSSGVYFVILEKDGKRYTKKVLIRK